MEPAEACEPVRLPRKPAVPTVAKAKPDSGLAAFLPLNHLEGTAGKWLDVVAVCSADISRQCLKRFLNELIIFTLDKLR